MPKRTDREDQERSWHACDDIERKLPTTIAETGAALRSGQFKCVDLVRTLMKRIEWLNPHLGAFVEVNRGEALRQAQALDSEFASGIDRGPLHGIPISIKDLFDVSGFRTTVGSEYFATTKSKRIDARVVAQLRAAGAIFIGKDNLAEFAANMTGRNSFLGDTRNPWNLDHAAGGSSGGTAAAVASGMSLGGLGSDTGGSIRFPASLCGVVGIRPTKDLISLDGAFPRAPSLDAAGPIARTVADAATMLTALVEEDRWPCNDGSDLQYNAAPSKGVDGLRIGIIENFSFHNLDPDISRATQQATDSLAELGAEVVNVRLPLLTTTLEHRKLFDILLYEFYQLLGNAHYALHADVFSATVRDNLEKGAAISAAAYEQAIAAKEALVAEARKIFATVDALITPTQPMAVPRLDAVPEVFDDARRFLIPTSFIGWPSVSVPCGLTDTNFPVGLHVICDHYREDLALQVAGAIESHAWAPIKIPPPFNVNSKIQPSQMRQRPG